MQDLNRKNFGISAGTQTALISTLVFANNASISFGLSNSSVITASINAGTATGNLGGIAAAGVTATSGTVIFSNSNNVSFGLNGQTLTATASYSQSTAPSAIAAGTQTATSGTIVFSDSNGISFGLSASTRVTASYTVPVVSNAIQDVGTATASGTGISQFAAHDHVHRGLIGVDVNGIASTFYGSYQLSAGNLISIATGGNTTRGSAQIINLLSSSNIGQDVTTATNAGTLSSRFALADHAHRGLGGLDVNGVASTFYGEYQLSAGNLMSIATGGNSTQGSAQFINLLSSSNIGQDVTTATNAGTLSSRFALADHAHRGVGGVNVNGVASTFYGNLQLSAGNLISLATGGNTTQGSIQVVNLLSSSNIGQDVTTATNAGTLSSRFALADHAHRGIGGAVVNGIASTFYGLYELSAGNLISIATGGNTTQGSAQIINVLSSSATALDVATASNAGTLSSRFALADHAHRGVKGVDINGVASTFYGQYQLSAGNLISIATGGNTTQGSAQIVNLLSSSATARDVATATNAGTLSSRFALADHAHRGIAGIDVNGVATTFYGQYQLSAGNLISIATGGNSTQGSGQIINLLSSSAIAQPVSSASAAGTLSSRFALADHAHAGLNTISIAGNTQGTTTAGAGSLILAGGNNISLSCSTAGGGMTVSINGGAGGPGGGINLAAGTQTATSGTIVFSDNNGISFGMAGSLTVTAAYDYAWMFGMGAM